MVTNFEIFIIHWGKREHLDDYGKYSIGMD